MTKSCYYVFSENEYKKIIKPAKYRIFTNNLILNSTLVKKIVY